VPINDLDDILRKFLRSINTNEAQRNRPKAVDATLLGMVLAAGFTSSTQAEPKPMIIPSHRKPALEQTPSSEMFGFPLAVAGMLECAFQKKLLEKDEFLSRARTAITELPEKVVIKSLSDFVARDRSRILKPTGYFSTALVNMHKRSAPLMLQTTPLSVRRRIHSMFDQVPAVMSAIELPAYELLAALPEDTGHAALDAFSVVLARGVDQRCWSGMLECVCSLARTTHAIKRDVRWE